MISGGPGPLYSRHSEVTEAVLNHISGTRASVAGIYNRYKYEPEKRLALEAWDQRLRGPVSQCRKIGRSGLSSILYEY